jgi:nucleotide-binding universal stress UspA family protein
MQQTTEEAKEERRKHLSTLYLDKFESSKANDVHFDVVFGDPKAQIMQKITEEKIDILIVGHRNLGMVSRVLLGSVSEYLVRNAPCSVLVC